MLKVSHVKKSLDGQCLHRELDQHLFSVAELASSFANEFGANEWAKIAGMWHDLGKYQASFQQRILSENGCNPEEHLEGKQGKQPHSTAGALYAVERWEKLGRLIAYVIAGHHAGLPDWATDSIAGSEGGKGSLSARLCSASEELRKSLEGVGISRPDWLELSQPTQKIPGGLNGLALWTRLVFSCLVDADYLDTESFLNPSKAVKRKIEQPKLTELANNLENYLTKLSDRAPQTDVNSIRAEVLGFSKEAAKLEPGLFSLTVPTGGGKTLSSLAFALDHAIHWNKRRVIYAIPFTSIIEQTADTFRSVFPQWSDFVLEHHSNLDPKIETPQNRLWSENWDAPLIVTTNVQLFESLFAAKTSRCRKLHNLVNSVVILDEAQQLPREFLNPILHVLDLLSKFYKTTFLFCTATQPALSEQHDVFGNQIRKGLLGVREIIPNPDSLAQRLKRVSIQPLHSWKSITDWHSLAEEMLKHDCVLTIVNRRADCRTLYDLLPEDSGRVHLSALMCGQHRSDVIAKIKAHLKERLTRETKPLRVVSTQLVEAGVDIDFPVVLRAMAGLDSIAQAAGRCNREGRLDTLGQVFVFNPEKPAPPGLLRQGEDTAKELLLSGKVSDPLTPKAFELFFQHLYSKGDNDKHGILPLEQKDAASCEIQFRTVSSLFKLISDEGEAVVVPYVPPGQTESPIDAWLSSLESTENENWAYRMLQRYIVNVPTTTFCEMSEAGYLESRAGFYLARDYDQTTGLVLPSSEISPASLMD